MATLEERVLALESAVANTGMVAEIVRLTNKLKEVQDKADDYEQWCIVYQRSIADRSKEFAMVRNDCDRLKALMLNKKIPLSEIEACIKYKRDPLDFVTFTPIVSAERRVEVAREMLRRAEDEAIVEARATG